MAVAVGNIIDKSMGEAADSTTSAADAADQAKAQFENLKVEIGKGLLPVFTNMRLAFNEFLKTVDFSIKGVAAYREQLRLLGQSELVQDEILAIQNFATTHQKSYGTAEEAAAAYLERTKAGYEELRQSIKTNGLTQGAIEERKIYQQRIKAIEDYIVSLKVVKTETDTVTESTKKQT